VLDDAWSCIRVGWFRCSAQRVARVVAKLFWEVPKKIDNTSRLSGVHYVRLLR
jgi:hypothetical protein